ncbi:STAS domain-containing protein [Terrabacter sp. BE26]|uniref:STAS domain-containing protein n=1 Tax=Terrabacter sp. BE26 TaxID=2898152 RepID=UPI0035BE5D2C
MIAQVSRSDGVATVRLSGEIDTYTVPEVRRAFDKVAATADVKVVVDLQEVTFLDSSGLGAIIALHRRVVAAGGRLELVCTGMPLQLLRLMALDQVIDVVPVAC